MRTRRNVNVGFTVGKWYRKGSIVHTVNSVESCLPGVGEVGCVCRFGWCCEVGHGLRMTYSTEGNKEEGGRGESASIEQGGGGRSGDVRTPGSPVYLTVCVMGFSW